MTAIRHTATLTAWNGEQGIAQADDGGQYSITRQQMYYSPYHVGSRVQPQNENEQSAMCINLLLFTRQQREALQGIIRSHIQAA